MDRTNNAGFTALQLGMFQSSLSPSISFLSLFCTVLSLEIDFFCSYTTHTLYYCRRAHCSRRRYQPPDETRYCWSLSRLFYYILFYLFTYFLFYHQLGGTALMIALYASEPDIAYLLRCKCDLNIQDVMGETAVHVSRCSPFLVFLFFCPFDSLIILAFYH